MGFVFKLYFSGEREYFSFGELPDESDGKVLLIKKDFPMTESLMSFLDLDVMADDSLFREMEDASKQYRAARDRQSLLSIQSGLDKLAQKHIFYEALRLDWYDRLERASYTEGYNDFDKIARPKTLRHTPGRLYAIQGHINQLFDKVLLFQSGKKTIGERAAAYFTDMKTCAREIDYYQFGHLTTRCEAVSSSVFTEVLYAQNIYDVIDFYILTFILREYPVRRCKNCGKWFVLTGHQGLEYCDRPFDEKGHTCRDVGAGLTWEKRSRTDLPFMAYRKEYKKRFARIKAGRITNEDFLAWGQRARDKKRECDKGTISLEEFMEWLENS